MSGSVEDVLVDEGELAAGFSVQTLSYPDNYELPMLGSNNKSRMERAVALEIDIQSRIKKSRAGNGYIHEIFYDGKWVERQRFESLDEVLKSDVYGIFLRKESDKSELEMHD